MLAYSVMAGSQTPPDYELADRMALTTPAQVKALSHPMRNTILGLLAEGRTDREIADDLGITAKTASVHVANLKGKLGVETRVEAVIFARDRLGAGDPSAVGGGGPRGGGAA